jgi:hypothetical protein
MIPGATIIGTAPICGHIDSVISSTGIDPTIPIVSILISGLPITGRILQNSIDLERELGSRGTLSFVHRDDTRLNHFSPGQEAISIWDGTRIFCGKIEEVVESLPQDKGLGPIISSVTCTDMSRTLDRFVIANAYDEKTLSYIIHEMFEVETRISAKEDITIGTIPAFTITKATFKYQKVSECLDDLCILAGYDWQITPYKVLEVYDRATFDAPFEIGDAALGIYRGLEYSKTLSKYRNIQWMIGGFNTTNIKVDNLRGDATTVDPEKRNRTFHLGYPVSSVTDIGATYTPTIVRITGGVSVTQRVGIRDIDKDNTITEPSASTWAQWFYSPESDEINQNSFDDEVNNPTLTADETLAVTYYGLYEIANRRTNNVGIAARIVAEGGSGIYENVEDDDSVNTLALSNERADRLLAQYGRVPATLKYECDRFGLEPGNLQDVVLADLAIDAQFMVTLIRINFPRFDYLRCSVEALDGERQGGWADFWRQAYSLGRKPKLIRDKEIIPKYVEQFETITFGDATTVGWDNPLFSNRRDADDPLCHRLMKQFQMLLPCRGFLRIHLR